MIVRPIRNESDYQDMLDRVESLMDLNPDLGTLETDELDVLVTLVRTWEDDHHRLPQSSPTALLEFALEQGVISRKDLEVPLPR